jgi:hypothetical protein
MTGTRIGVGLVFLLLLGIIVGQAIDRGVCGIRIALAEEQCQFFVEMADKAVAALNRDPPSINEAIDCLESTHRYYPSGTKQVAGSPLDRVVETCRRASERRIIEVLKATAGSHLGNDADAWIEHFPR